MTPDSRTDGRGAEVSLTTGDLSPNDHKCLHTQVNSSIQNGFLIADGGRVEDDGEITQPVKYRGVCDYCGEIEFDEHPEGQFGPECPACEAVLRVVKEYPSEAEFPNAYDAANLREANEMVSTLDGDYEDADPPRRSELVTDQVGDPNAA